MNDLEARFEVSTVIKSQDLNEIWILKSHEQIRSNQRSTRCIKENTHAVNKTQKIY